MHLSVFVPNGNCARCGFNQLNGNEWRDKVNQQIGPGICIIRGFDIDAPLTTYCKNYDSRDSTPFGCIYVISGEHGGLALPWVDKAVPHTAPATCCICNTVNECGTVITLPDGAVEFCSAEHYLAWWSDYLARRLAYFKLLGERAYSDMYDVVGRSASGFYSDAKEAFHSAISTARDLELVAEQHSLEERLAHIKDVFRGQFK